MQDNKMQLESLTSGKENAIAPSYGMFHTLFLVIFNSDHPILIFH